MELKLVDKNGKLAKKGVTVSDDTFGREFNEALVHQVVVHGECPYSNTRSKRP